MKFKLGITTLAIGSSFFVSMPTMCLTSCSQYVKVKEITKQIFETDTYTSFDMNFVNEYFGNNFESLSGGCSAITKKGSNGHRLVGRNMDLNVTNKCVYIVKTAIPNKHKTLGLEYTFRDMSDDYEVVKAKGINPKFHKILPFMCEDVLNDQGLYIEVNLREAECWPNYEDKFSNTHTNDDPKAESVYIYELLQLIALNCKNVDEAKIYVDSLNIFSNIFDRNYCFLVSDPQKSSLLEIAQNKVCWTDEENIDNINYLKTTDFKEEGPINPKDIQVNALGQTNFYVYKDFYDIQDTQSGLGRFDTLQQGITNVNNAKDMYNLMKKVEFSKVYDPDKWADGYDPRSEMIGAVGHLTKDYLMNMTRGEFQTIIDRLPWKNWTREQKAEEGICWETTFCEAVDVNDKVINCRFFEDDNVIYRITFDKIEKITEDQI